MARRPLDSIPGARDRWRGMERVDIRSRMIDTADDDFGGLRNPGALRVESRGTIFRFPGLMVPGLHVSLRPQTFAERVMGGEIGPSYGGLPESEMSEVGLGTPIQQVYSDPDERIYLGALGGSGARAASAISSSHQTSYGKRLTRPTEFGRPSRLYLDDGSGSLDESGIVPLVVMAAKKVAKGAALAADPEKKAARKAKREAKRAERQKRREAKRAAGEPGILDRIFALFGGAKTPQPTASTAGVEYVGRDELGAILVDTDGRRVDTDGF